MDGFIVNSESGSDFESAPPKKVSSLFLFMSSLLRRCTTNSFPARPLRLLLNQRLPLQRLPPPPPRLQQPKHHQRRRPLLSQMTQACCLRETRTRTQRWTRRAIRSWTCRLLDLKLRKRRRRQARRIKRLCTVPLCLFQGDL
jgi:hypothetical protein